MQRIIIHLGAHRCGSTTIQRALKSNRARLAADGIAVFTRRELVDDPLLERLLRLHRRPLEACPVAFALCRMPERTVVLSDENILGLMPGIDGSAPYHRSGRALTGIGLLARLFDCSLRWVVRRQDRFIESAYAFRVLRGATDDLEGFSKRFGGQLHWSPIAQVIARRQSDSRIALFEGLLPGSNAKRILEFLGLPTEKLQDSKLGTSNARAAWTQGALLNVVLSINRKHPELSRSERMALASAFRQFGRELPMSGDLQNAIFGSGVEIPADSIRAAHHFAATAPLPEFGAEARRALLEHYREDHLALEALSCVDSYGANWREP